MLLSTFGTWLESPVIVVALTIIVPFVVLALLLLRIALPLIVPLVLVVVVVPVGRAVLVVWIVGLLGRLWLVPS